MQRFRMADDVKGSAMDVMNRREVFGALAAIAALGVTGADAQAVNAIDTSKSRVFKFSEMVETKSANGGWSRAVVKGTLPTGEFIECHETMLPIGKEPHPPHRHPNTEFILLREGKLQYLNEGAPEEVVPGDVIFTASNRLHGLKNIGTVEAKYYVVSVSKQLE
jgi:mannose-6-phosphate isomerase-like protein (cupin superfamily)